MSLRRDFGLSLILGLCKYYLIFQLLLDFAEPAKRNKELLIMKGISGMWLVLTCKRTVRMDPHFKSGFNL